MNCPHERIQDTLDTTATAEPVSHEQAVAAALKAIDALVEHPDTAGPDSALAALDSQAKALGITNTWDEFPCWITEDE